MFGSDPEYVTLSFAVLDGEIFQYKTYFHSVMKNSLVWPFFAFKCLPILKIIKIKGIFFCLWVLKFCISFHKVWVFFHLFTILSTQCYVLIRKIALEIGNLV